MLAYASHRRPARRLSPSTLLLIAGGHAALLAAVMAIRMEVAGPPEIIRTEIRNIPLDAPPPPPKALPKVEPKPSVSSITSPPKLIVLPMPDGPITVALPEPTTLASTIGTQVEPLPGPLITPPATLVTPQVPVKRVAARLLTPPERLRPPYPEAKRRLDEEAVLRLRLTISADGRVTAVEPVGAADPAFLASARAHLIQAWRYAPAKEGGTAVGSNLVITLRFELEE